MNELVYPREKVLGGITLVLGILVWLALILGTMGIALIGLLVGFIIYIFAQSAFIAYIRGSGVEVSEEQFPDIYSQFKVCCDRLEISNIPQIYILNGNGGLNAFATKFLKARYVVLMTDVVDAMDEHEDGVCFYIGHELGHLRMKHLEGALLRWPVLWLPLLGAAYSRARESTCDRHGLACCSSPEAAARALAALSAGVERWKGLDLSAYRDQTKYASGFWMSFHELNQGYPWLTKRVARVMDTEALPVRRNPFAYILAVFVPYAGRLGGGFGLLITVYIIGVLAAVALPQYQTYVIRAQVQEAMYSTQTIRAALADYYELTQIVPESLDVVGVSSQLTDGSTIYYDPSDMAFTVGIQSGDLIFVPNVDEAGEVFWFCVEGEGLSAAQIPPSCEYIAD